MFIKKGLAFFLLLIHLQSTAGELIKIESVSSTCPTITVNITDEQAKALASNMNLASNMLKLYMIMSDTLATIPVSGNYHLKDVELSFSPTYTLGDSREFEVQYKGNGQLITKRFTTPSNPRPVTAASVLTIYPRADTVPYNTLFFHIRFGEPMLDDMYAYKHVRVYDENGVERENAWRQKSFWLDSNKLLVLMIHPGRVKSGIKYGGALFDSGKHYTLKVEAGIKDANGRILRAEYTQQYYVGGKDRICPKADIARNLLPSSLTREAVILSFSENMDHASVTDGTIIYDHAGNLIPCIVRPLANDSHYEVIPAQSWQKGKYTLVLKSAVYDIAANRIRRLFETNSIKDLENDKLDTVFAFKIN